MEVNMVHSHPQSKDVINRLARIEGHVRGIKQMAEEGKPCHDVLHQIGAVQAALRKVAQIVLEDHMDHCITEAIEDTEVRNMVESLKDALEIYMK
jgi:CsoR family transcriptional regulator, copper-sensing transcriptional repressor